MFFDKYLNILQFVSVWFSIHLYLTVNKCVGRYLLISFYFYSNVTNKLLCFDKMYYNQNIIKILNVNTLLDEGVLENGKY